MRACAGLLAACLLAACRLRATNAPQDTSQQVATSRLSDRALAPQVDLVPKRPRPLLEWGNAFLGNGPIAPGVTLPTGAVLQPSLLIYGSLRTALQSFDDGRDNTTAAAARLDLFANLQLSGTERLLVGLRPLDEDGRFTRQVFDDGDAAQEGWNSAVNAKITTLFFEGELGEIFPAWDPGDSHTYDLGFSIGRQPLRLQNGLLLDDRIDALGITRNTQLSKGSSNLRSTALVGWNEIHRGTGLEERDTLLIGLFHEADLPSSTVSLDAIWVRGRDSDSDALFAGIGLVQRLGHFNTSLRMVGSYPLQDDTPETGKGALVMAEISRNVEASDDLVYATAFVGLDQFSSAARSPESGGPLGSAGILFAAPGLGQYGSALDSRANDSYGGAVGWQSFLGDEHHRRQLILEIGARLDTHHARTDAGSGSALAAGLRAQQALGRHSIVRLDGFVSGRERNPASTGVRLELQLKF